MIYFIKFIITLFISVLTFSKWYTINHLYKLFILEFVVPINLEVVGGTMGTSQKWATGFLFSWHKYKWSNKALLRVKMRFLFSSLVYFFNPPKIFNFISNFTPQNVNKNQIFKNFDFYLSKFPHIENICFQLFISWGGV
jgi:hypothetical protein